MNQILCLLICFFVGVLVFYLLKNTCGCKVVEGQNTCTSTLATDYPNVDGSALCRSPQGEEIVPPTCTRIDGDADQGPDHACSSQAISESEAAASDTACGNVRVDGDCEYDPGIQAVENTAGDACVIDPVSGNKCSEASSLDCKFVPAGNLYEKACVADTDCTWFPDPDFECNANPSGCCPL